MFEKSFLKNFNLWTILSFILYISSIVLFFSLKADIEFGGYVYKVSCFDVVMHKGLRLEDTVLNFPIWIKIAFCFSLSGGLFSLIFVFLKKIGQAAFFSSLFLIPSVLVFCNILFHNIKILNIELVWIDFFVSLATFLAFMKLFDVGLLFKNIFRFATFFCIFVLLVMVVYLFVSGVPAIFKIGIFNFLFGTEWLPTKNEFGILPFILCSIVVTLGAVVVGVPIGVLTSVFLSEFCHPKLSKIINVFIKLLAGIPSVVFGFFGMLAVIPIVRKVFYDNTTGDCLLTAIIILSMMILPTIISISESSVKIMSERYFEASLALGESKARSIFKVVVPAAKKGILSGVFLGLGKAVGETMAVIMVSGNAVNFPDLLKSSRFLTTAMALEFSYAAGLHREALFSIGLVLFIMIFIMNMIFVKILKKD